MIADLPVVLLAFLTLVAVVGLVVIYSRRDAVVVGTAFLVALFGVNARYVIPGGGAVATPATAVALAAAWWWWMGRIAPSLGMDHRLNPVRIGLLSYLWYVALSWGLAYSRPLSELEINGSNRAMITALGLTGIALLLADGISTRERLEALLRRTVAAGAALSTIGVVQFFTGFNLAESIRFPGLVLNSDSLGLATRSDFRRAEGTALHSIEFSVVLAMLLPLAIHYALNTTDPKRKRRYVVAAALIAAGVPLSVARSGVLALAVALVVLGLAWTWRQRLIGIVVAFMGSVVMYLAVPGLVGTIRSLFSSFGRDPSVTARIDRIPLAMAEIAKSPWFGSGVGTFSPDEDFLLDNQYFGSLIELGIFGVIVILALFAVAIVTGLLIRGRTDDPVTGHLAQALVAGVVVLPATMATFDAFFYRILMGVTFLFIGSIGALWRLEIRQRSGSGNGEQVRIGGVRVRILSTTSRTEG